jgi:hypothetical protein
LCAAPQDLEHYKKSAVAVAKKYFTINDIDDFYKKKDARPLIFCHFARGLTDKTYDEVCSSDCLQAAACDPCTAGRGAAQQKGVSEFLMRCHGMHAA